MDENKESATAQENPQQTNGGPLPTEPREWLRTMDKNLNEFLDQCADPEEAEFLAVATTKSSDNITVLTYASDATVANAIMAMAKSLPKALRLGISLKIALHNG